MAFGPVLALAQDAKQERPALPGGPPPVPEFTLPNTLETVPVRRGLVGTNTVVVDPTPLVKDPEGIWVLDFAFKPMRIQKIDVPGKGPRPIHYLYYRVINRTGKPRVFVPQFTVITDTGKRYEDTVLPEAVKLIQAREDPTIPLKGAVDIVGMLPPSGRKEGIDDAVFGVAVWDGIDPKADAFKIYVRGLSNGYQEVTPPGESAAPQVRYKSLRIDFSRPGDDREIHEREIRLLDPPYEWVYW